MRWVLEISIAAPAIEPQGVLITGELGVVQDKAVAFAAQRLGKLRILRIAAVGTIAVQEKCGFFVVHDVLLPD